MPLQALLVKAAPHVLAHPQNLDREVTVLSPTSDARDLRVLNLVNRKRNEPVLWVLDVLGFRHWISEPVELTHLAGLTEAYTKEDRN